MAGSTTLAGTPFEWATDFVQWEPAAGLPPSQQKAFEILYDENNLYVAYRAHDREPDGQFARGRDARGLFDRHPHDVFLLEISKWFSL